MRVSYAGAKLGILLDLDRGVPERGKPEDILHSDILFEARTCFAGSVECVRWPSSLVELHIKKLHDAHEHAIMRPNSKLASWCSGWLSRRSLCCYKKPIPGRYTPEGVGKKGEALSFKLWYTHHTKIYPGTLMLLERR